ncbi:hypothetical protein GGF31_006502 [Allomyces arbusculus]|nr:hypothetical protein GGF31_006502 [Allomyces arbusculus]
MHPLHAAPPAAHPAAMPGAPTPAAPAIGDPRWLPHAHATITNAMAHSLACLHLWDDMHHAHALLRRDADTLNEHARSIDQHMAALDKRSRRLARQEDQLARRAQRLDRAMAQFDAARAAWCRAAGLPSDTYAVQLADEDGDGSDASDSEDDDEDEVVAGDQQRDNTKSPSSSTPAAPTTANSMVGGLVGSAWKSLDRAYAVRSKLGAVPLVGSLVQSALPENDNENEDATNPPDSQPVSAPTTAAAVAPPLPYAPYAPYYLYYPGTGAGGSAITPPTSIPDGGTTSSPRAPSVSTTSRVRSAAGAVLRRAASVASLSLGSSAPATAATARDAGAASPTPTHATMYPYYASHAHTHARMVYAPPPPPATPYAPAAYTPPQVHPAPTVDELGHLVQSMASVASVANSVTGGAASPAGMVKSVGGWALNKVLGGGSKAGGSTTGAASG